MRLASVLCIAFARAQFEKTYSAEGLGLVETWSSTDDIEPSASTSYGEIGIGVMMSIEFDMVFHGRSDSVTEDDVENFFRIGYSAYQGNHCGGSMAHYPSLWIPADSETPYMILTEGDCSAVTTQLDGLGDFIKGDEYHFDISWTASEASVTMTNNDAVDTTDEWTYSWTRDGTHDDYLGESVPVWFMTDKFSIRQYNVGNATFSNIVITSEYATDEPTKTPTDVPTHDPTKFPTGEPTTEPTVAPSDPTNPPTMDPTVEPSKAPTQNVEFREETSTTDNVINKTLPEKRGVSALTIAIIVIVVLCVVLACHAVFLIGKLKKNQNETEGNLSNQIDEDGNVHPEAEVLSPEEDRAESPSQEPEQTPEPLEQLSAPDSKLLELSDKHSGFGSFVHQRQDTESQRMESDGDRAPDLRASLQDTVNMAEDEESSTKNLEDASQMEPEHTLATSTRINSEASSTRIPTEKLENEE